MQNVHVTWLLTLLGPGISGSSSQVKIRDAGEICFYWHASQEEMTGDYFSLVIRNLARYSYNAFTHQYQGADKSLAWITSLSFFQSRE
jgi:hypothetical protein